MKLSFFGRRRKQDRAALEQFVQQIYWGENLTAVQSRQQLERGLLELTESGNHAANGLLITANGYFLTAAHCTEDLAKFAVQGEPGEVYAIEKICAADPESDVALVKARIPGESKPLQYRFYNSTWLESLKRQPVALFTRRNGTIITKYGFVENPSTSTVVYDEINPSLHSSQVWLSMDSCFGDSGGIVASDDARIIGIHSSGNTDRSLASGVKLFKALELIGSYAAKL